MQMYKIFCDQRCLYLCTEADEQLLNQGVKVYDFYAHFDIKHIIPDWLNGQINSDIMVLHHLSPFEFFGTFYSKLRKVYAAGGILRNPDAAVLFIYRNNFWDLPKGHADFGETPQETALREVQEETELTGIEIIGQLPESWHCYRMNGIWHMKCTYWFEMAVNTVKKPIPQIDEGILLAEWVMPDKMPAILNQCYRSVRETLGDAIININKG